MLKNIISNKINSNNQVISFREFMQIALYYPKFGYYSGIKNKISSRGDFVTATSQSSLFARTFARQFAQIISQIGQDCNIVEFGAGTGKFAADCMDELANLNKLPQKYIIIELSGNLKLIQQQHINKSMPELSEKFVWMDKLPQQKIKAIVFANEVLDAMPVDIFKSQDNQLIQQGVTVKNEEFIFINMPINDHQFNYQANRVLEDGISFDNDYISEINTWINPWIKSLKNILAKGVVFICDYGYHRKMYYSKQRNMGTLACYYQHQVNFDPLINIGSQDITAHIDFTAIAEAIADQGFQLDGYMTQANFLKRAGISEVFTDISKKLSSKSQLKYNNDIKNLLLGEKFTEIFKVLGFSINFDTVIESFDNQDNISYLL